MRKLFMAASAILLVFITLSQSVWAFSDTKGNQNDAKITALQKLGILAGTDAKSDLFQPNGKLTYAAGISMIVTGLGLSLDGINFFKKPELKDFFPNLKENTWYANNFIIAAANGLEIPNEIKSGTDMTREQFAHHLVRALLTKGDYAFIDLYATMKDEAAVNPAYMDSIQKLLTSGIAKLDSKQQFNPTAIITRGDAAGWLYDAIQFVERNTPAKPTVSDRPFPLNDVKLTTRAINSAINEITISAQAPNPGYSLRVTSITFEGDQAIIHIEPVYPDKNKSYAQVIADVKVVTYVAASYTPVLSPYGPPGRYRCSRRLHRHYWQ